MFDIKISFPYYYPILKLHLACSNGHEPVKLLHRRELYGAKG